MKLLVVPLILLAPHVFGQELSDEFGFNHLQIFYKDDTVDVLIKIKKGDELKQKPLFFFCQGSLPKPLLIYDEDGPFGVFPFKTEILTDQYHLAIVGKPFVPLKANRKNLDVDFCYRNKEGNYPDQYLERDNLDYYVDRDLEVLSRLKKLPFVSKDILVVTGHSEGSSIVSKLATRYPQITHVIYSGGNPYGRIMSMVQQCRASETDSSKNGDDQIKYWKELLDNPNKDKSTCSFSNPQPIFYLKQIKKPVLVTYGTKDDSAPYNDLLHVEFLKPKKMNFTFKSYVGLEHNYFSVDKCGEVNDRAFYWDKVAIDWLLWLQKNKGVE